MIVLGRIQFNIVRHCTNRCVSCSAMSPFAPKYFEPLDQFTKTIDSMSGIVKCNTFYLTGGEPTLHPHLVGMMRYLKGSPICNDYCVISNGQLLHKLGDDFWGALSSLSISLYKNLRPGNLDLAKEKQAKFKFGLRVNPFDTFYAQFGEYPGGSSFSTCNWKLECYTIFREHFYLCPQSAFMADMFLGEPQNINGLPIAGITKDKLIAFMGRDKPFTTCKICCGQPGNHIPWGEANTQEEWIERSTVNGAARPSAKPVE